MKSNGPRITLRAAAIAALALALQGGPRADAPSREEGPHEELSAVLADYATRLFKEKNEDGASYRRGVYSRSFKAVGETYRATFHRQTASESRLTTERLLLTMARDPETQGWAVVEEEVVETHDRLVRAVPGDETFYRFDAFEFDREGLRVSAADGYLYMDYFDGKIARFVLTADHLSYGYAPPAGLRDSSREIYGLLQRDAPDDFLFEPERISISCSPRQCLEILAHGFDYLRPVDLEDLDPRLQGTYEEFRGRQEDRRIEDAFSGFGRPYQPGNEVWAVAVRRKGLKDHLIWLAHDNWGGWEVYFGASNYGALLAYHSEETRASGRPPYELERREDANARDFDLRGIRGTVELALAGSETMRGDVTFTLTTKRDLRELPFYIARLRPRGSPEKEVKNPTLIINSIQDENEEELTWVKMGSSSGLVILPEKVGAGTTLSLRVQFENQDAIYKLTPSYSVVARSGWLPFVRFADLIQEYDLTVKVPSEYTTLGVGEKVMDEIEGDVSITRWVSHSPVNFPTVIYGDYFRRQPGFEAKKSDGTNIPITIYADKEGMTDWNIRPKQLPTLAEEAANALNLYREIFGVDYPYAKLDLVNDPLGGLYGQSPASIVYLGSGAFRGEGWLGTLGGTQFTKFTKSLVAHEVGHQWWGGLVANANDRNYWFVESLSEYSSALFLEAVNGRRSPEKGWKAYLDHVLGWREQILSAGLWGSVQGASTLNVGGYRTAVYAKGPYAFHMLRMKFGSEKMFAFLKQLAREVDGKEIVTGDIQRVAEEAFEVDMDWFFDQWIRGVGIPEYRLDYSSRKTEDGTYLVAGTIRQQVVIGKQKDVLPNVYYRGLVPVTIIGRNKRVVRTFQVVVEGAETTFLFRVPYEPRRVILNRNGETLAHDVEINEEW